ncbi:MAG: cystathionine gamma-synthase [Actinomycetota bacterium]|jgi:cystathionine gamma-synthase|nr:cystathionine gamma-synthase [Actinomycetota bacterium]
MDRRHRENPLSGLETGTIAVTAGRPPRVPDGPLNAPLVLASTYHAGGEVGYGRYGNPTWEMLENAIGALEGGLATSFASGMAATAAVLDLVPDGGLVVAQQQAYYGTLTLLREHEARGRLRVRPADLTDRAVAAEAIRGADLVWVESPTNPMLLLADVPELLRLATETGALGVVDNTFATPVLQQPLALGAAVVVHSVTKYLSGHSDLLLGAAVVRDPALAARLVATRSRQGSVPGAFEAWLALRGLRTVHLRVRQAQQTAATLAERLASHPEVSAVHYPGQGAMVSFEVAGGAEAATRVTEATQLWVDATSLGGVESSLERRRRWPGESADVPESLIRLSVGIEDVDDLWQDLAAALASGVPG